MTSIFSTPGKDQVVAFAGIFQAAMLVRQLANGENHDDAAMLQSALSVLRTDANSVTEVYSSLDGVRSGCRVVDQIFSGKMGQSSRDLFQYAVAMHQLGIKLPRMRLMSDSIHEGLAELSDKYSTDDPMLEDDMDKQDHLYEELARIYAATISTLTPRIMVRGSQGKLSEAATVNRVRSALFAGIRAALLWHQVGGRRWQLLLHRRKYQSVARRLGRI